MELFRIAATFRDGTQQHQYAISRFAAALRHAEYENQAGMTSVTTEPFTVPAKSYPAMTAMLNQLEGERPCAGDSALNRQEGGDHYTKLKIQPMQYSMANGLDACQHTAIKYITRFRDKGGVADLRKARHVIDMLIEMETKDSEPVQLGYPPVIPSTRLAQE